MKRDGGAGANVRGSVLVRWLIAVALLVGVPRAAAQTATGTITGTVTDPAGLAMAGANVEVHNLDTGSDNSYLTNETGLYVAPYLQPGNYEVAASKTGFEKVVNKGIAVHVGQIITIDIQLPLQAQQATVTVTTEAPILDTEKTEHSQVVTEGLVDGLPMATRRWENFVLLTPAVTTDGTSGLSSFRGISALYNGNSVDGANNTQAFFSEARGRAIIVTYVYSPDSIKEFQVASSNYSAELGQAAGGVVNAVTKSGTNVWHGDLFYNLRYPDLNALDPLGKSKGIFTQTVHQQNQFGGSFGGPIIKDKLFFFGTYDGFRKVNPILYTSTTGVNGINALTCPTSASAEDCANGKAFVTTDLLGAFPRNLKQDVFLGKIDYQMTQTNHVSLVYNWQDWREPYGYNTAPTVNNGGATQNGSGATHERFLIANWTSTLSSNKVNEVRYQWGQDFEFDSTNSGGPSVSLLNIASYGETSALPRPAFPDEHRNEVSDNFTLLHGSHTFKMGVNVNFIHELLINLFQGDGNYSYNGTTAFDGCPAGANATFCRWLDDAVGANVGDGSTSKHYASFTQVNDPITHVGKDDFYDNDLGVYFEDTWKMTPKLTLNLGARYDLQHVPRPPVPNTSSPLLTLYTSTLNIDANNLAPRIGIAWQFDRKTVLRAGYGIFYGKTSNSTYYALRVENGVFQQTFSGCGPNGSTPALKACAPTFPNVFFTPPGPAVAAPFAGALTPTVGIPGGTLPASSAAAHGMTPTFVSPAAHEGEVTLERELPWRMSISATYLLTRGLHLPASYDANVAPATMTETYDVLNSAGTTVLSPTVPYYTARLDTGTGLILNQYSVISSWYNGLVVTLRKPMSHEVELLFNYTYSKALDDGETAGTNGTFYGTDAVLDPYNLKGDYSYSDLDQRHRFVGSAVWEPMYAKDSSNAILRQVVDGWDLSTIVTAATGQPFTAQIGTTFLYPGSVDGGMTGGVVSTFASATGGRASWLPRNSFNLPNFTNVDFRIGRGFTFLEKYKLSFTADAFNLFNSTIVSAENTTAYTYAAPGTAGVCSTHAYGCLIPSATFRSRSTTSGLLYGARQLQFGARFEF
ncbi:MAG TPA: TonB-dependent receptor [Verrucomicrobiae bacterium]|nr:TonB-dependent receptor [Verrucomicrobiae bacterium]